MADLDSESSAVAQGGFVQRLGTALAAPARAMRDSDRPEGRGRAPNDLALLLLFGFVTVRAVEIISALWMAVDGDLAFGAQVLLALAAHDYSLPLLFLFASGIGLILAVGARRRPGADFDLACIAAVPLLVVQPLAVLVSEVAPAVTPAARVAAMLSYGWSLGLIVVAFVHIRRRPTSRPGPGSTTGGES